MDSKQLVNDIVNKRFSKARDTIHEELVNRIVTKVESMGPESGPKTIHEALGLIKKAVAGVGLGVGAFKAGKKIAKFLSKAERGKRAAAKVQRKSEKEAGKKTLADIKSGKKEDKAAKKAIADELDKLRDELKSATTDEDKKKIKDKIQKTKDEATEAGISWKRSKGDKAAAKAEVGKKGKSKATAAIAKATGKGETGGGKPKPTKKTELEKEIEAKEEEKRELGTKIQAASDAGAGSEDEASVELVSQMGRLDKELEELKKQLPAPPEEPPEKTA